MRLGRLLIIGGVIVLICGCSAQKRAVRLIQKANIIKPGIIETNELPKLVTIHTDSVKTESVSVALRDLHESVNLEDVRGNVIEIQIDGDSLKAKAILAPKKGVIKLPSSKYRINESIAKLKSPQVITWGPILILVGIILALLLKRK